MTTQIFNTSKAHLAVFCNKSKCIQIQVHFHFAQALNTIALRWPARGEAHAVLKKRFSARYKVVVCRYIISELKTAGMPCFQDHSEMKKHFISKLNLLCLKCKYHLAQSLL